MKCPICGNSKIIGEVGSFWVSLDKSGDIEGQFGDFESSSDLTGNFHCNNCDTEFTEELADKIQGAINGHMLYRPI